MAAQHPAQVRFDVCGIGNALVDVLAHVDDGFLAEHGLVKGSMALVDDARADALYAALPSPVEASGGSAANTVAGLASLGSRAAYIGRVRDDQLGRTFADDLRAIGVAYDVAPAEDGPGTGRCAIVVTPDAERTMSTFLGASAALGPEHIDPDVVATSAITYLEGYLWDRPEAKEAYRTASRLAHDAGRLVALTLSDSFCVDRHRDEWLVLVDEHVDVLFANADELRSLYRTDDLEAAIEAARGHVAVAAVTLGPDGCAIASEAGVERVAAEPVPEVVDTTGAGDLFASGFLHGLAHGMPLATCGRLGSVAAAEVIGHTGARPSVDLRRLAGLA